MEIGSRPVVFRFTGGFLDGRTIDSADDMGSYYAFLSDNGRVGARFRVISPEAEKASKKMPRVIFQHLHKIAEGDAHSIELYNEWKKKCAFSNFEVRQRIDEPERTVVDLHYVGDEIEPFRFEQFEF